MDVKIQIKKEEKGLITSAAMCIPVTTDREWYNGNNKAPLFEGLGGFHFPVSTKDTLAQKYFDQGIILAYGFNHAEAAQSFYYATRLDPGCAMAFWSYAYVLGPNYNDRNGLYIVRNCLIRGLCQMQAI